MTFVSMRDLPGMFENTPLPNHEYFDRSEICGKIIDRVSVNGKLITIHAKCGDYRNCPRCNAERIMLYRNRLLNTLDEGVELCEFTIPPGLSSKAISKLVSPMGKDQYMRVPQPDGSCLVFAVSDNANIPSGYATHTLSETEVRALDWPNVVKTPPRRRITGDLGCPEKPEQEKAENHLFKKMAHVLTDATSEQRAECFKTAVIEDSASETPNTVDELEAAMDRRVRVYAKHLQAAGRSVSIIELPAWGRVIIGIDNIKKNWYRLIPGQKCSPRDYIEDYVEWKALVDSVMSPITLDPNTKVDGD
jgi:hypothetical protein